MMNLENLDTAKGAAQQEKGKNVKCLTYSS